MATYHIPSHVHFAVEGDAAVFLDLRSDRYSMLIGAKGRLFKSLVSGRHTGIQRILYLDHPLADHEDAVTCRELIADLTNNHLISAEETAMADPAIADIPLPEEDLLEPHQTTDMRIRARDMAAVIISCAIAKWRLSFSSIEHTVNVIHRRRRLYARERPAVTDVRRLVRIYNQLRPLVPHSYLCLFDSLALLEFLARHDCYPSLVFAVQLEPWNAHCWVQQGGVSFNESIHKARTYLPLLSV